MDRDEDFTAYMTVRWPVLVRSAVLLGCTTQEAEDLVQTALSRCYVSWSRVTKADDRDAYVYRVLVNTHIDSRRRHWWKEQPTAEPTEEPASEDATVAVDDLDVMERALAGLSEVNRSTVVLRFYSQLSEQQTAKALGIPVGTVKSRLSRALKQLSSNEHFADLPDGTTS